METYLKGGLRDDVTEEDGGESILVLQQTVQGLGGDLVEGGVGGSKDSEGSGAGQGVDQTGGLDGGEEGRELRGGNYQVGDGLGSGGSLYGNGSSRLVVNHRGVVDNRGMMDVMVDGNVMASRRVVESGLMVHNGRVVDGGSMMNVAVDLVHSLVGGAGAVVNLS